MEVTVLLSRQRLLISLDSLTLISPLCLFYIASFWSFNVQAVYEQQSSDVLRPA